MSSCSALESFSMRLACCASCCSSRFCFEEMVCIHQKQIGQQIELITVSHVMTTWVSTHSPSDIPPGRANVGAYSFLLPDLDGIRLEDLLQQLIVVGRGMGSVKGPHRNCLVSLLMRHDESRKFIVRSRQDMQNGRHSLETKHVSHLAGHRRKVCPRDFLMRHLGGLSPDYRFRFNQNRAAEFHKHRQVKCVNLFLHEIFPLPAKGPHPPAPQIESGPQP